MTSSLSEKDTTWMFERGIEFYEYICTCSTDRLLLHHIDILTKIAVKMDKCELPTFFVAIATQQSL